MRHLFILLFSLLLVSCVGNKAIMPTEPEPTGIIGKWQIIDADRADNEKIEILDFRADNSLLVLLDTDGDQVADKTQKIGYQLNDYLGRQTLWILWGNNEYEWAYPAIGEDTLKLDMIRIDTPRVAHYTRIQE